MLPSIKIISSNFRQKFKKIQYLGEKKKNDSDGKIARGA